MHRCILNKVRVAAIRRRARILWVARAWGVQSRCSQLDLEFRQCSAQSGLGGYCPRVRTQGEGSVPAGDVLREEFSADEFCFLAAH